MITKAEIQSIDFTGNTCVVRMPLFESAAGGDRAIATATISNTPGSYNGYKEGDVVLVAFENGQLQTPCVIGKLYLGASEESKEARGSVNCEAIVSEKNNTLPLSTKIINDTPELITKHSAESYKTVKDIIERKQDKLTAGNNITISYGGTGRDPEKLYIDSTGGVSVSENPATGARTAGSMAVNGTLWNFPAGGSSVTIPPERLTFAQNLVVNGNGYQMPNVKFGNEQTYGTLYVYRVFQDNSTGTPITDTTTIKNYLTIMTGNDAIPVYDLDDGKACFIYCSESNTLWKIQRWVDGATPNQLWAFKVVDTPFSLNIKDGTGENSIRQATSVAGGSNSAALGHNTETSANCTFTAGTHTFAGCHAQTAIGKYNTKYTGGNLLFVVGNGNADDDRSDAFKVWTNGTAEIKAVGTGDNAVVNKKYIDDRCITEISTQTAVIWDLADGLYKWTYEGAKTINYSQGTQAVASIGTVMLQVQSTTGTRKIFLCERDYQSSVYGYVDSATVGGCYAMSKLHGVSTCNGGVFKNIYAPETVGSDGQYLKSNGSGAPTWTTLTHSYRHDIMLYDNATYFCCFSFINNNPMQYTTSAAISAALAALGFIYANGKFLGATGPHANSTYRAVAGAQGSNVWYLKGDNAWANGDWGSISDVVTQIC